MSLLDTEMEDVIEGHILPLLMWNDLLRFRRVCKYTHKITTKYMRVHPELAPEIQVTEQDDKNFKAFMAMAIPTTKLYLNNTISGYKFYEKDAQYLDSFVTKYGSLVKSLRVKELSLFVWGNERAFFQHLKNLESLEADYFGFGVAGTRIGIHYGYSKTGLDALCTTDLRLEGTRGSTPLPLSGVLREVDLAKLKIKVGQKADQRMDNVIMITYGFLFGCPEALEYLSLPFNSNITARLEPVSEEVCTPRHALAICFNFMYGAMETSLRQWNKVNLKVIDFANYHDELEGRDGQLLLFTGAQHFLSLCLMCLKNNVKLLNVGPTWFGLNNTLPPNSPSRLTGEEMGKLAKVVGSLVNINPLVFDFDMPNLTRIDVRKASQSAGILLPGQSRPLWSNLKSLEIYVDCKNSKWGADFVGYPENIGTYQLFNLFFKDVTRINLVELCLKFKEDAGELAIPKAEDIVSACPNLKKLTIVNWPGKNKALIKLWEGLHGLEEIVLENGKQMGNVAFVGLDVQNPVFLKLKKLKKLSLKHLDKMPKLTDLLFSLVIRHLKLTHFTLTTKSPAKSVTLAGVETLLTGPFKDSIEKFPFRGWSLENVTPEEFQATEKKFRSFNMI